jgi:hypothetical protein
VNQAIIYRGREFRLRNPTAIRLMRRAVAEYDAGDDQYFMFSRRLVSLAVRNEAGLITSVEAWDAVKAMYTMYDIEVQLRATPA